MASNKRQSDLCDLCDEEPEPKRRQQIYSHMKLSDLTEDVVVKIFLYLNRNDLLNVVYASSMFLECCRRVVEEKSKKSYVQLPLPMNIMRSTDFIHYFGKNIAKITISYRYLDDEKSKRFHDLVVETCHATLTHIEFCDLTIDLKIDKCFPQLKSLYIYSGNIDGSLCEFTKWFPKLEKLSIYQVQNIATRFNSRTIPTLRHFSVHHACVATLDLDLFMKNNPLLEELDVAVDRHCMRNAHNYRAINSSSNVRNAVSPARMTTVRLRLNDAQLLPYLTNDRIENLEVNNCTSNGVIDFVASCCNLRILKYNCILPTFRRFEMFDEWPLWKKSAKHVLLTHLEISFYVLGGFGDFNPLIGLFAILPYLEQCNKLSTVKVRYGFDMDNTWMDKANASNFDPIKDRINRKQWAFTFEILLDKTEVSFMLNKL